MSENKRPLILVTNDDGIEAQGISALVDAVRDLGDVVVVAPRHQQSAVGQAITMRDPLKVDQSFMKHFGEDVQAIALTGTPADCVKFACQKWMSREPDMVLSGINHGPNTAVNVLYSGTVGGAAEGCVMGIPSIAFSLDHNPGGQNFNPSKDIIKRITEKTLLAGLRKGIFLNVNIPHLPANKIKGIRVVRMARSRWEEYFEERKDPGGNSYYWLDGSFLLLDSETNHDVEALQNGEVALTPLTIDWTAREMEQSLSELFEND